MEINKESTKKIAFVFWGSQIYKLPSETKNNYINPNILFPHYLKTKYPVLYLNPPNRRYYTHKKDNLWICNSFELFPNSTQNGLIKGNKLYWIHAEKFLKSFVKKFKPNIIVYIGCSKHFPKKFNLAKEEKYFTTMGDSSFPIDQPFMKNISGSLVSNYRQIINLKKRFPDLVFFTIGC